MRLFKKPDLKVQTVAISESTFRDIKALDEFKKQVTPKVYLQTLYAKIEEKERDLHSAIESFDFKSTSLEVAYGIKQTAIEKELKTLESQLVLKREEREQLERPLTERANVLNQREKDLDSRDTSLTEREQALFEGKQAIESKLDAIRDLSNELGGVSVQLTLQKKKLEQKEAQIAQKEIEYLARQSNWQEYESAQRNIYQTRENNVSLRELNIESKAENLTQREEALLQEKLLVQSQRQALMAAKNNGKSSSTNRNIA